MGRVRQKQVLRSVVYLSFDYAMLLVALLLLEGQLTRR